MDKKILLIDNYDSFTYNLVHIIEDVKECKVDVYRNDELDIEICDKYDYIIISPGPGLPSESGLTKQIIETYYMTKKIFGVCLGLQAIVEVFGGQLKNLSRVFHGIETKMRVTEDSPIYKDIPENFVAGRYHSWVADKDKFPQELIVNCVDDKNEIMGIHHNKHHVHAVQFHPESTMTPHGKTMLYNFLNL